MRFRLTGRAVLLTLGVGALYTATFDSDLGSPDETSRFRLAVELARHGLGALRNSGGLSRYPPLQSLLGLLPARLGLWLDHGDDGLWTHRLVLGVSLVAAVALVPLFHGIACRLGLPERRAAAVSTLFALTNPLWPYSKRFFSEPLSAVLALGAFAGALAFIQTRRAAPLVGCAACLFLLPLNNMVVPVAVLLGLAVMFGLAKERRALVVAGGATALGAGLAAALIYVRFGSLGSTGYAHEGFTFHIIDGLHGLLFGWGRSIFLFAPLTFLALFGWRATARQLRPLAAGALVTTLICIGIISAWWSWWGGICWGPRLVLPILPVASLGAIGLLARPARWKTVAAVAVGVAGLWVQLLGFSFKHDFDIYFWMHSDYSDEPLAWFDLDHSVLTRMPRHFRDNPWDLSSAFLSRRPTGASTIDIGGRPVRRVRIEQHGGELMTFWSITDLFVVVTDGAGERRVPAAELGARLETFNHAAGSGALDGNPETRWSTETPRREGMWVTLEFPRTRTDVLRLELVHAPHEDDFPNALTATVLEEGSAWTPVPAHAAVPRLVWDPTIFVLLGGALLLLLAALLPG